MSDSIDDADLNPTQTQGYKITDQKTIAEYSKLDEGDESLNKWKLSLGITQDSTPFEGPRVVVYSLALVSDSLSIPLILDITAPDSLVLLKKNPITIKEGSDYAVELKFKVQGEVVTGLRYIQVVKRSGIKVDKLETMIGSYGPSPEPILKKFASEEAPSGMLARSGSYNVRSRVIDDDGNVYADFEWGFKLGKEW